MTCPFQFTCGHCGQPVTFMDAGLRRYEHRNQCPYCLYSKHIMFGTETLEPCDGLMRPGTRAAFDPFITQQCETCGFRWVNYLDDHWATLPPDQQVALINQCYERTERENRTPTVIYLPRPEYRTEPPRIPAALLGTRKRVNWRP